MQKTLHAMAEMTGAAGLRQPGDFLPHHLIMRESDCEMVTGEDGCPCLPVGILRTGGAEAGAYQARWARASG